MKPSGWMSLRNPATVICGNWRTMSKNWPIVRPLRPNGGKRMNGSVRRLRDSDSTTLRRANHPSEFWPW